MVMPGSAPATIPTASPRDIRRKFIGWSALMNPAPRWPRTSSTSGASGASEDAKRAVNGERHDLERPIALGQRKIHRLHEQVEQTHRADHRAGSDARGGARARHPHEARDESQRGERKSEDGRCEDVEEDQRDGRTEPGPLDRPRSMLERAG